MKKKLQMHLSVLKARSLKLAASSGFTIMETLVAIAILLLTVTAPLAIAERGLVSSSIAKEEVTATYLAQEAVEFVRNIRDGNALQGRGEASWLQGLEVCVEKERGCGIDVTAPQGIQVVPCNASNDDCTLYQYGVCIGTGQCTERPNEPQYGVYGHRASSGWVKTNFTRKIYIEELAASTEASATVRVQWNTQLGERMITVKENVLNWYDSP